MSEFNVVSKPVKCPYCDKEFVSDTAYSDHIQSHKGKACRVFKLTPKGEAVLKAIQAYAEVFNKELASKNSNKTKGDSNE